MKKKKNLHRRASKDKEIYRSTYWRKIQYPYWRKVQHNNTR